MSKKYAFLMDMISCNNCKTCEVACKMERHLPYGIKWRKVRVNEYVKGDTFESGFLTMSCNHCENPACMDVCPVSAYSVDKVSGAVISDSSVCIGCQSCVYACPYGAPSYDKDINKTSKCDMCIDRLNSGLMPVCSETCPNNALIFGDAKAAKVEAKRRGGGYKQINNEEITPDSNITKPSIEICPTLNSKI